MLPPRRLQLLISPQDAGASVGTLLRRGLLLSAGAVRRAKCIPGGITLDGAPVFTNARVSAGQLLSVQVGDALPSAVLPREGSLTILYEDEDLLLLDKPGNLAVHPGPGAPQETLANRLMAHYVAAGLTAAFHPVNRLDRGTSGLMAVAKHAHAHERLITQLHSETFVRGYLAICQGAPPEPEGCLDFPIARCPDSVLRRQVAADGQAARTRYRLLAQHRGRSLLALRLDSGRTHQIRVHLSHVGAPIVGDFLYGQEVADLPLRFALHAAYIRLHHPLSGAILSYLSPLPSELSALLPADLYRVTQEDFP